MKSDQDEHATESGLKPMTRRELLQKATAAAVVGSVGMKAMGQAPEAGPAKAAEQGRSFPAKFLWGCATAAHQVEGNNVNSDYWMMEHLPHSMFKQPSGDACDHYHLYRQDNSMLAELGFNSYRFSIEWARIEPEEGFFSNAELEHYRRMLACCHEHQLTPLVTYYHFSLPRWFAVKGGWNNAGAVDLYARYCERATRHLGDLVGMASTMNEPDLPQLLNWIEIPGMQANMSVTQMMQMSRATVRKEANAPEFGDFFLGDAEKTRASLLAAHAKARDAMKSVQPGMPVGFNLAMQDDQPAPEDSHLEEKRKDVYAPWLEAARQCDYLGVQTYSRSIVGKKDMPPPKGAELTQTGMEFYPECVEHVVRYAAREARVPIYVTENGIATQDDTRRVEYYRRAVAGLKRAIDDGVDARGYVAWSLLDNFEWMSGFTPKFGLVAVNLETQQRTIKPSATFLGNIARRNAL
ncbi:MAG TPA: family 1 glycosylhydrolase [Terracidiphilus sp.]|nr:family 1 glycosylhydrolase [Terracidiphilus sp.]